MAAAPFSQAPGLSLGVSARAVGKLAQLFPTAGLLPATGREHGVSGANGWDVFHQLLRSGEVPARLCTDAYLAALSKPELPRRCPVPRPLAGPPARNSWGDVADLLSRGKGFSAVLCCSTEC